MLQKQQLSNNHLLENGSLKRTASTSISYKACTGARLTHAPCEHIASKHRSAIQTN